MALPVLFTPVLLGFAKVIPVGVAVAVVIGVLAIMFAAKRFERAWFLQEFERMARRPTWASATDGSIEDAHRGQLVVFRAAGYVNGQFPYRRMISVVCFDEVACVVTANSSMLGRVRRNVIRNSYGADLEVRANTDGNPDCMLVQESSGLRVRLLPERRVGNEEMEHFGLAPEDSKTAEWLRHALVQRKWTVNAS